MNKVWSATLATSAFALFLALLPPTAEAGCGCDKPPPPPAQVRPSVAYTGAPISFFSPSLTVGKQYTVTFANGISGSTASVKGLVVSRRDLANNVFKPQLIVPLPRLPLGPTSIMVTGPGTATGEVLFIGDANFTVAPDPMVVPSQPGAYNFQNFKAAVSRGGVTYVSLDLTNVTGPLIVDAQAVGYPLRFGAANVVFYDIQGFLMQQLVQAGSPQPIPGMWVAPAAATEAGSNSDLLRYSRHEFETYFLQHEERQPHAVDPTDPNWHLDGTRHVDHNHLILAISGKQNNGALPAAGATPAFTLRMQTYSLFYQGIVGVSSISGSGSVEIDSYDSATMATGFEGDVFTNGKLTLSSQATINGNATAQSFALSGNSAITGTRTLLTTPVTFMEIKVPTLLTDLGQISLSGGATQTVRGPGSFLLAGLTMSSGSKLVVDNSAGPVTFYVTGGISLSGGSMVQAADPNPEKFAIYVTGTSPVSLSGASSTFYGVVYAPYSAVSISGSGEFSGSFIGDTVRLSGLAQVHYDSALQ